METRRLGIYSKQVNTSYLRRDVLEVRIEQDFEYLRILKFKTNQTKRFWNSKSNRKLTIWNFEKIKIKLFENRNQIQNKSRLDV